MSEMIRIVGPNRRVIKFSKVSSVQYLGYFKSKVLKETMAITVFEYEPGVFEIPGIGEGEWDNLQQVGNTILDKF